MKNKKTVWAGRLFLTLCAAQLLLVIVSWMVNATAEHTQVRSLISSEGIRWFMGHFVEMVSTPLLAWMLLLAVAAGLFRASGLLSLPRRGIPAGHSQNRNGYRRNIALAAVLTELVVIIIVMLFLTLTPNAILRSASGELFPSSFSACLVPVVAFSVSIASCTYGGIVGTLPSIASAYRAACQGIAAASPYLLLYIAAAPLYFSGVYLVGASC